MNSLALQQWFQCPSQPLVMGILNVTDDSFFDGGKYVALHAAYDKAHALIKAGADIIDIGGESTRPFAREISVDEELSRVIPVIDALSQSSDTVISVDTSKPEIMIEALKHGAHLINDVNALQAPGALAIAAQFKPWVVLMHRQGDAATMQLSPDYPNGVIEAIDDFFQTRISHCVQAGIAHDRLIIDPGFGFGKTVTHNLQLVNGIAAFKKHNCPILLGVSRKSTLGVLTEKPVEERMLAGIVMAQYAITEGANIIRTHDVAETKEMIELLENLHSHDC